MCGIAVYIGNNKTEGLQFAHKAQVALEHRGPDDSGIYNEEEITMLHRRLAIIELSPLGHQPMQSSCGRYIMVYNGEIYNHTELRKRFLSGHSFRGNSDTETALELFRVMQEKMLYEMVGMWAFVIWDKQDKRIFISRDRYGQKPIYIRKTPDAVLLASEVKTLLNQNEVNGANVTAIVEYLAMGNYGHLNTNTFFGNIQHFPQGCYAWLKPGDKTFNPIQYWRLPDIPIKDKRPFNAVAKKEMHDRVVEAVMSQTMADVPIGITLSGGIDSSIVAGILAKHSNKEIHVFTAQTKGSKYDESKYVDAVIELNKKKNFVVHRRDLGELSIRDKITHYIKVQEEPFGDPSIMAHGTLMRMAADAGIKVILNGQGADELFFGYDYMAQAILLQQLKTFKLIKFRANLDKLKMSKTYAMRALLQSLAPWLEVNLRYRSRMHRRSIISTALSGGADNSLITHYDYSKLYDVWRDSIYGVALPHLVHYEDRNGMSVSLEGRTPFLDHRIAEHVATIHPEDFLRNGLRKYLLREACREYLPDMVYNRTDKIGFYTPLVNALYRDADWVATQPVGDLIVPSHHARLMQRLKDRSLDTASALQIWRAISVSIWAKEFNIHLPQA